MAEYRLAMAEPILVHANGDRELQNKGLTLRHGVERARPFTPGH